MQIPEILLGVVHIRLSTYNSERRITTMSKKRNKQKIKNLFPCYKNFSNINTEQTCFSFRMKLLIVSCSLVAYS